MQGLLCAAVKISVECRRICAVKMWETFREDKTTYRGKCHGWNESRWKWTHGKSVSSLMKKPSKFPIMDAWLNFLNLSCLVLHIITHFTFLPLISWTINSFKYLSISYCYLCCKEDMDFILFLLLLFGAENVISEPIRADQIFFQVSNGVLRTSPPPPPPPLSLNQFDITEPHYVATQKGTVPPIFQTRRKQKNKKATWQQYTITNEFSAQKLVKMQSFVFVSLLVAWLLNWGIFDPMGVMARTRQTDINKQFGTRGL